MAGVARTAPAVRVYEFPKNAREMVIAEVTELTGHRYVNLRVHWRRGDQLIATKKGLTFDPALLPEFVIACEKLREALGTVAEGELNGAPGADPR